MKKITIEVVLLSVFIMGFSLIKVTQGYSQIPTIYFDGSKKEISLINDNNGDLFNNLKELMPGDERTQNILLKLDNINSDTKVYLKIVDKEDNELPQGVTIKLYQDDIELEKSGEFTNLGTFSKDKTVNLKVVLKIPNKIGNEIQNLEHRMKWELFIQENEKSDNENTLVNDGTNNIIDNNFSDKEDLKEDGLLEVPYTYDDSNVNIYIIICIISFIVMICSIIALIKEHFYEDN